MRVVIQRQVEILILSSENEPANSYNIFCGPKYIGKLYQEQGKWCFHIGEVYGRGYKAKESAAKAMVIAWER